MWKKIDWVEDEDVPREVACYFINKEFLNKIERENKQKKIEKKPV